MITPSIEERLRHDLTRAAEQIRSETPVFVPPTRRRWGWRRTTAVCAIGLAVAGGGTAVALHFVPDDVKRVNEHMSVAGSCGAAHAEQSTLVATATRADGNRLELWATPTSTGHATSTLRIVRADGQALGDTGACGNDSPEAWAAATSDLADGATTAIIDIYGRTAPTATTARVTFISGTVITAQVQHDGYFVTSLRDQPGKYEQVNTVEPLNGSGQLITP